MCCQQVYRSIVSFGGPDFGVQGRRLVKVLLKNWIYEPIFIVAIKLSGPRYGFPNRGTNESGFTAYGGGYRSKFGELWYFKELARYWINDSTESGLYFSRIQ